MSLTCETRRAGGVAGPENAVCFAANSTDIARKNALPQAEVRRNPTAVIEARCELIRELIFENLGAARLFIDTAQNARRGSRRCWRASFDPHGRSAFQAAVTSANELSSVKAAGR
jgi:hypothetical protein